MKRLLLFPVLLIGFAAVALAGDSEPRTLGATRLQQFRQNQKLIEVLVERAIYLAGDDDHLGRAAHSAVVAERLVLDLEQAARDLNAERSVVLAQHLHELLEQGLAVNFSSARSHSALNATAEKRMRLLRDRVASLLEALEADLRKVNELADRQDEIFDHVHAGMQAVDRAVKESPK